MSYLDNSIFIKQLVILPDVSFDFFYVCRYIYCIFMIRLYMMVSFRPSSFSIGQLY